VEELRVATHKQVLGLRFFPEHIWHSVLVFFQCQAVNHIDSTQNTPSDVTVWEHWQGFPDLLVKSFALVFNLLDLLWFRSLNGAMDPEWSTVLSTPVSPLKSFKSHHQETCPRLMHAQAHARILLIFKEVTVTIIKFHSQLGLL